MNQGNLLNNSGHHYGAGGASFYLFTNAMINSFVRAVANTTFGQYSYDFASLGIPGLKTSAAYLRGKNIKATSGIGNEQSEWERDLRVDYVIQTGALKGFGTTLRPGKYRGDTNINSQDHTRLIFNYTCSFM